MIYNVTNITTLRWFKHRHYVFVKKFRYKLFDYVLTEVTYKTQGFCKNVVFNLTSLSTSQRFYYSHTVFNKKILVFYWIFK